MKYHFLNFGLGYKIVGRQVMPMGFSKLIFANSIFRFNTSDKYRQQSSVQFELITKHVQDLIQIISSSHSIH